jgi:undecaprenyl-diphosphatase
MRQVMRRGAAPRWPGAAARVVARLVAGWAAVLLLVIGLGLLVTGALEQRWPLSAEDDAERGLQSARTPLLDRWTDAFSQVADTATIMVLCGVAVWVLRGRLRRWREALLVAAATIGQSAVFLSTTLVIDRERPGVPHLDEAPPTSSFPSGHSSAALALFGALALVVHRCGGPPWLRRTVVVLLLAVPPLVMAGRMYRGMHHPSDILGSVVVGGLVLFWSDRVLRSARLPEDR